MIVTKIESLRGASSDAGLNEAKLIINCLEKELAAINSQSTIGVGLAAPQIGIKKRVAIVRVRETAVNLVNAKIECGYGKFLFCDEGCLSFPGTKVNKIRYGEIHVVNNLVEPERFIATGFLAVAIQHELDHLDGILLSDNAIKTPRANSLCWCGSGKKFKGCHGKQLV